MQSLASDEKLKQLLDSYAKNDNEFWSFRGKAEREHVHGYFQYPAMMVPKMQGQLIQAVLEASPATEHIFDPFVGSGTVMTEAMLQGLNFTGQDINPLAILLCRAKMGIFFDYNFKDKVNTLVDTIERDQNSQIEANFPRLDKWFRQDVAIGLSRIRRAIRREKDLWVRRFLWVALAETVRLTSNSRTSTFKLHVRCEEEIKTRQVYPIDTFKAIIQTNINNLLRQKSILEEKNFIEDEIYKGTIDIRLGDSTKKNAAPASIACYDLLVTSPPYGDNRTTVPYGQHSFLPLQWIDLQDIDENLNNEWIATTYEIDNRSLAGSLVGALEDTVELMDISKSFKQTIDDLKNEPKDRRVRVAAFCRDFNKCIDPILSALKPNSYMIWTVGNRRVANRQVPIDAILLELLNARGVMPIAEIRRNIPTKRMAVKNKIAATMGMETILVLRKGDN